MWTEGLPTIEGIPGPSTQDNEENELEMYFFINLSVLKPIIELVDSILTIKTTQFLSV